MDEAREHEQATLGVIVECCLLYKENGRNFLIPQHRTQAFHDLDHLSLVERVCGEIEVEDHTQGHRMSSEGKRIVRDACGLQISSWSI